MLTLIVNKFYLLSLIKMKYYSSESQFSEKLSGIAITVLNNCYKFYLTVTFQHNNIRLSGIG